MNDREGVLQGALEGQVVYLLPPVRPMRGRDGQVLWELSRNESIRSSVGGAV